jgi:hypothetical protein
MKKPRPERDLPRAVSAPHPALGLRVSELVPERAAGGVAPPVQRHQGRLHVPGAELEVLLDGVQHGAAAGVDAEVVERHLEVGDVGPGPEAEDPAVRWERPLCARTMGPGGRRARWRRRGGTPASAGLGDGGDS